ncbi:MAG: type II toxin-antitoxin system mRNA interferase toxin, RelE/StbE family [Patescibacteria group bacterium]|jgi:addiction module RelE/StbE family toxin
MQINFSKRFNKQYKKAALNIQRAFNNRLQIFIDNKFHSSLHNHALTGQFEGFRSINVTGDWRALFHENEDDSI